MIAAEDESFLAAVLTVAARAQRNGQSVERVADDYLAEVVEIPRIDLILCAAETLRLIAELAQSGPPPTDFPDMVRLLARGTSPRGDTAPQRTLRLLAFAHQVYRRISMALAGSSPDGHSRAR